MLRVATVYQRPVPSPSRGDVRCRGGRFGARGLCARALGYAAPFAMVCHDIQVLPNANDSTSVLHRGYLRVGCVAACIIVTPPYNLSFAARSHSAPSPLDSRSPIQPTDAPPCSQQQHQNHHNRQSRLSYNRVANTRRQS